MKPLIHYNDYLPDLVRRMEQQVALNGRILLVVQSRHMISALEPFGFKEVQFAQQIDHRSICTSARFLNLARELERSKNQDITIFMMGTELVGNHRSKTSRAFRRLRGPRAILFSELGFDPAKAFDVAVACDFHKELGGNREGFNHLFCVGHYVDLPGKPVYWVHKGMKNLAELAGIFRKHIDREGGV